MKITRNFKKPFKDKAYTKPTEKYILLNNWDL